MSLSFARISGRLAGLVLTVGLVACGGGGGSAGAVAGGSSSGSGSGSTTVSPTVADLVLFVDKNVIQNGSGESATLTVMAVDAARNVVPSVPVSVTSDQGSVFVPGRVNTNDAGVYTGSLSFGGDKTNRDIAVTVVAGGITKRTSVRVSGSRLTLQVSPPSPAPGQTVSVTATLVDSAGRAIAGSALSFAGTLPGAAAKTGTTDLLGQFSFTATAPAAAGTYLVSSTGSGVSSADYQVQVFASAVPVAVIPAGVVPSLSANANVLSVNTAGSTTNQSTLRFIILDPSNRPIPNVRVRFVDATEGLAAVGASILSSAPTLLTDASGTVTAQYVAGLNSSPTNGVTVRACYRATDFPSATGCASGDTTVPVTLTVAGQALAVSVGDDNLISAGNGTYIKRFAVTVADSAGRAVPNAAVDIAVDLTHFGKGYFEGGWGVRNDPITGLPVFVGALESLPLSPTAPYPAFDQIPSIATPESFGRVWCPNEDTNRNGNVDPGENIDGSLDTLGQPTLEPRKSDLIVSYDDPNVRSTNASGVLIIRIEYSQRFATWLGYRLQLTASVVGSQGRAERRFITTAAQADVLNGSFRSAPYGTSSCNRVN